MFQTDTYKVDFWYDREGKRPIAVNCIITDLQDNRRYAIGLARCNPHDNFDRTVGRKLALSRAMLYMNLLRSERAELWAKYFEKVKKK